MRNPPNLTVYITGEAEKLLAEIDASPDRAIATNRLCFALLSQRLEGSLETYEHYYNVVRPMMDEMKKKEGRHGR